MYGNFFSENDALFAIMWENMAIVGQATHDNIVWRMEITYSITKATSTHSEYVIYIAFAWQQWLCELPSMLRYTNIVCIVMCSHVWSS
jgi:hypothetical protein